jgi:heat shock 70kDa protein 1/2/6/8
MDSKSKFVYIVDDNDYPSSDDDSVTSDNQNMDSDENITVGIDLGTTNSLVAVIRNNNYEIIPDEYGNKTIPSIVSFTNRSKYVGMDAKNQMELNPDNTFYETKRLIGRKYSDSMVKKDIPFLSYSLMKDQKDNILLKTNLSRTTNKLYFTPEEIASHILQKLKMTAENYLKKPVKNAVITVPAYFNDAQRQATKDAATIAGLNCIRVINEPTAAALMYGLQKKTKNSDDELTILVYDLGGGTLDCSILRISDGVFEVLASTGNTHLGGADFDNALVTFCINRFKSIHNTKLTKLNTLSLQKLKKSCERAKKLLSINKHTTIAVKDFHNGKNLIQKLTRKLFVKICKELFIMCLKPVEDVINSAEIKKTDIDEIILVGGCTRIPIIKENLKLYFNGKEPNSSINPDEVVAAGAAIQAYILSHSDDPFSDSVVLLDIVPLSLGVKTIGGEMNVIIPRNTRIPTTRTRRYTTDTDYETSVDIEVYEGERTMTKDNFKIGEFVLEDIEKAPRGIPEIDVKFSVDVNGIINVTAIDKKNTENKKSIIVKCNKGRLTQNEITELIKEAEDYEVKDKLERQLKRLYYEIDDICSNIKINLNNDGFKLKENDKNMISTDIDKVIDWLKDKLFYERNRRDYRGILKRIRKRYGTLILKVSQDADNVKASGTTGIVSTTVFDDDDDIDEDMYKELEKDEYGFTDNMKEKTRRKIKDLRENFVDLCHSVYDIISTGELNIEQSHLEELNDYINDNLLWVHIKQRITVQEYEEKMKEINKICDQLADTYKDKLFDETEVQTNMKTKHGELEQLCYAIKSSIDNNYFSFNEKKISELSSLIDNSLEWLVSVDVKEIIAKETDYVEKIDKINSECDHLYQSMLNINIDRKVSVIQDDKEDVIIADENVILSSVGTSISALKDKQKIDK